MIFHWDDQNLAHIARHEVSSSQAEAAFGADDARVFPEGFRIITAHWMSAKLRRKP